MAMLFKSALCKKGNCGMNCIVFLVLLVIITILGTNSPKDFMKSVAVMSQAFKARNGNTLSGHLDCSHTTHNIDDIARMNKFRLQCNVSRLYKLNITGDPFAATNYDISQRLTSLVENPDGSPCTCPRLMHQAQFPIPRTGLLSFPGSGNTWTRHLLHQLTGIQSGTIYASVKNASAIYPFNGQVDNVIVVKTHIPPTPDGSLMSVHLKAGFRIQFHRLIIILRNPYDALSAEFKRQRLGLGSRADYIEPQSKAWIGFVTGKSTEWKLFVTQAFQTTLPTLVLFYEDLKTCLLPELIKMSGFLHSPNLVEFSYCCALQNREGFFHKPASNQTRESIYSNTLRALVNEVILDVVCDLKKSNLKIAKRLMEYTLPHP